MTYLNINKNILDKHSKSANEAAIKMFGDDGKSDLLFENLTFISDDGTNFDEERNCINFSGELTLENETIAYISDSIPLDLEVVIEIIEAYRKKLGKLKTVLEATK